MANLTNLIGDFDPTKYAGKRAYTTTEPPRIAAIKAMQEHGLIPPPSIATIGELFRFKDGTDRGQSKSAWGIYYEYMTNDDIIGLCIFGSWKGNPDKVIWSSKLPEYMTTQEQRQLNEHIEHAKQESQRLQEKLNSDTAQECQKIWDRLPDLSSTPYTQRKNIKPYLARSNNGVLTVPLYDDDKIVSLQYIADDGSKRFHTGGKTKGTYLYLKGNKGGFTFITEGYATGCSIHEATGCDVYICWNANNIYEFCAKRNNKLLGKIIIAADDDYKTAGNPGISKAKRAAEAFGYSIIAPIFKDKENRGTDFNDVHCLYGIEELYKQIAKATEAIKHEDKITEKNTKDIGFTIPDGVIGDIYRFYMTTSGNYQPGFAIQTALAIVSTMTSRYFITDCDNHTTLFFLNVGKTATGKEHCKKVVEHIFRACKLDNMVAGDGFTSSAAVMSLMLQKPVCVSVIDEFGRYLEAAGENKGGMQKEANTTLMESIGRPDGVLRPKNYSTMTLTKEQAEQMKDRVIYSPAMTLLALTTPSTFFDNIKMSSVLDGFLNRFLVHVSDAKRAPRKRTSMMEVPNSIIEWSDKLRSTIKGLNSLEIASEIPKKQKVYFSNEAVEIQQAFEIEMIDLQNELEPHRMDGVPARANEWAMRLALCLCLSRNPDNLEINAKDMQWSVDYMRKSIERMVVEVRTSMSETQNEANKKDVFACIKAYRKGITWTEMQKVKSFMKYSTKELKDILQSLVDAELVDVEQVSSGRGRPATKYTAIQGAGFK